MRKKYHVLILAGLTVALMGCNEMKAESDKSAQVSKEIIADTKQRWRDLFTYRKEKPPALPQTRYCYQTQADIACYDSPQNLTSKLIGYQDGTSISWIQPGGGSLGVSGGEPTAQPHAIAAQPMPMNDPYMDVTVSQPTVDTSPPPIVVH